MAGPNELAVVTTALQSYENLPNGIEYPLKAVAGAMATGAAIASVHLRHNHTEEKYAEQFPNPVAAEQAVRDVRGGELETPKSRRRRLVPVLGMLAGAGLMLTSWLGKPTHETTNSDKNANIVTVVDGSNSMQYTKDIATETRYDASVDVLQNYEGYEGKMAVNVTGADQATKIPLSRDWKKHTGTLDSPAIDPNGGDLSKAISDSVDQLPLTSTKNDDDNKRDGRIVIVTDGASVGDKDNITEAIKSARKDGVDTKAVVLGQPNSSYTIGGFSEDYGSGANTKFLDDSGLKPEDIMTATNPDQLARDMQQAIESGNTISHKRPAHFPMYAGAILLAAGAAESVRRAMERAN